MIEIGRLNSLRIVKETDFGLYLDGGDKYGEILLPLRYVPERYEINEIIEVFIYFDSEDRIIATTETPFAMVGEFACLKVVSVSNVGAFMNWGLMKDLLVPFREQKANMEQGRKYVVFIYLDNASNRIAASSKIEKYIDNIPVDYKIGEEKEVLIYQETTIGYKAIIDNAHSGLIYKTEVFTPLLIGQKVKAFISKIREDEKIDLTLKSSGEEKINELKDMIIQYLKNQGGFVAINDKTDAETIYSLFGVSKKVFKKTLGVLYKNKKIIIANDGIRLT